MKDITPEHFEVIPSKDKLITLEEGDSAGLGGRIGGMGSRTTRTITDAINQEGNLVTDVVNARLDSEAEQILGEFTFGASGAIKMITDENNGLWFSPTGILAKKAGANTLTVTNEGDVTMAGTITAVAGSIGGWNISATALYYDGATDAVSTGMASADYPFYAGKKYASRATAPFRVTSAGSFYASEGNIEGNLTVGGRLATTVGGAINIDGNFINEVINAKLDTSAKTILGDFTFGESGAIKMITDANNGLWISPTGILGKKAGENTFTIGIDGSATFAGTLSAATGTLGSLEIASGGEIVTTVTGQHSVRMATGAIEFKDLSEDDTGLIRSSGGEFRFLADLSGQDFRFNIKDTSKFIFSTGAGFDTAFEILGSGKLSDGTNSIAINEMIRKPNIIILTSSQTWTVPTAARKPGVIVEVVGAGGGGQSVSATAGDKLGGAGGGGGGYSKSVVDLTGVSSVGIVIGAAGAPDSDGTGTSFGENEDYEVSANGGKKADTWAGGKGGTSVTGTVGVAGSGGCGGDYLQSTSGAGGSSFLGGGGNGVHAASGNKVAGESPVGPAGGGGSGAASSAGGAANAGMGKAGICIITYYTL